MTSQVACVVLYRKVRTGTRWRASSPFNAIMFSSSFLSLFIFKATTQGPQMCLHLLHLLRRRKVLAFFIMELHSYRTAVGVLWDIWCPARTLTNFLWVSQCPVRTVTGVQCYVRTVINFPWDSRYPMRTVIGVLWDNRCSVRFRSSCLTWSSNSNSSRLEGYLIILFLFCRKTYFMGTHGKHLAQALLTSGHNIF